MSRSAAFNKAGIAVEYLAWPREGVTDHGGPADADLYRDGVGVVRRRPQGGVYRGQVGHAPKPATCTNPVKDEFDLGLKLGVDGTPTIIGPNGRSLGGYVTPEQLLQALERGG